MLKKIIEIIVTICLLINFSAITISADSYNLYATETISNQSDSRLSKIYNLVREQNFNNSATSADRAIENLKDLLFNTKYKAFGGLPFPMEYRNTSSYKYSFNDGLKSYSVTGSLGCMLFSYYASMKIYNREGNRRYIDAESNGNYRGSYTPTEIKNFLLTYAQVGAHIRVSYYGQRSPWHSMTFIAADENGFFFLNYVGDKDPYVRLHYTTYDYFSSKINSQKQQLWLYDSNLSINSREKPTYYTLTLNAPEVKETDAKVSGRIPDIGGYTINEIGLFIGTNENNLQHVVMESTNISSSYVNIWYDSVASKWHALTPNTRYYYRLYGKASD